MYATSRFSQARDFWATMTAGRDIHTWPSWSDLEEEDREDIARALGSIHNAGLIAVRQMLGRLLKQTQVELEQSRGCNDPSVDFHRGAEIALLAALNFEPLRTDLDRS